MMQYRGLVLGAILALSFVFSGAAAVAGQCNDGVDNDGDGRIDYAADANCFDAATDNDEAPPAGRTVGGFRVPDLQDERNAYTRWGWSFTAGDEPNPSNYPSANVYDPDVHNGMEGDDLWSYVVAYVRTGKAGYLDRARKWARYFKQDYRNCVPGSGENFCFDRDNYQMDHLWGWGLIAWYELTGDTAALDEAKAIGDVIYNYWSNRDGGDWPTPGGSMPDTDYSMRGPARQLHLAARLAEVTGEARFIELRDRLTDLWIQNSFYNSTYGMYFVARYAMTACKGGANEAAYDQGLRCQSSFQIGVLSEALYQVWRTTGRTDVRDRLVAMARYVDQRALDPTHDLAGSWFGVNINTGATWINYAQGAGSPELPSGCPVQAGDVWWDAVYTISLVDTVAFGGKLANDQALVNSARHFLDRGTKGVYGSAKCRTAGDNEVDHFVDAEMSSDGYELARNNGELQYTWLLFDPSLAGTPPPSPPTGLTVQ